MLPDENAHRKSHFFQALIEENPDFLKNPERYPSDIFSLFTLFFGKEKLFNNYAIFNDVDYGVNYIFLMTRGENPQNIYQINEIRGQKTDYRVVRSTQLGIQYLKLTVENILNRHVSRSIEEILHDLKKEKMEKLEHYLRFRSNVPDYSIKERMVMTGIIFYSFFEGRDTKISFDEYCIEVQYRKEHFTCSFLREDSCELKFEFDESTRIMKLNTFKGSKYKGALKLQGKIAEHVFNL
ncbi:MAG: hypothetical protein V4504_02180 [Patescibacteria group bacterium]